MNRLSVERRAQVLAALVDGASIRATTRMFDVAKGTVLKLLVDVGRACRAYQDTHLRGLKCKLVQCDEIWAFCYSKAKNVSPEHSGIFGFGDVWTFVALDPESKLVPCFHVGKREAPDAEKFMRDLESRLAHRVQLTTDGHSVYFTAVEKAFGWNGVDYSMLVKIFASDTSRGGRYSPAVCLGAEKHWVMGNPDERHVSTSHVERSNLTMRMGMRRFTRLTNGFSKKVENLEAAVALHFFYYNFARIHKTTRVTPAMAAGVDLHLWTLKEIADMADTFTEAGQGV